MYGMVNRQPEVSGDIDEQDWPEALDRALEQNRRLEDQIAREREESNAKIAALVSKLGGDVTLTAPEIAQAAVVYNEPLAGGGWHLTLK